MGTWVFGTDLIDTFIWCAPEDTLFLTALEKQLVALSQDTPVSFWHDGSAAPGDAIAEERARRLQSADVFLALVSADLLAWPQFQEEATIAFQRRDATGVSIVPVVLRACDWRSTALGELAPLPGDGVPIAKHDNDAAWVQVVDGLRTLLRSLGPPAALLGPS